MYRRTTHAFGAVPALSLVADGAVVERGKNEAGSCPCLVLFRLLLVVLGLALLVLSLVLLLVLALPALLVLALPALLVLLLVLALLPLTRLLPVLEVLCLLLGAKRHASPSAALFLPFSAMPAAVLCLAGARFSHDRSCSRLNRAAW
jgi:hypothetical protein